MDAAALRALVKALCDRSGIFGADGVYFVDRQRTPARAEYFNSDGSSAEYSGNGLRCVGRMLLEFDGCNQTQVVSGGTVFEVTTLPPSPEGVRNIAVRSTSPVQFDRRIASTVPALGTSMRFTSVSAPNPHLIAVVDEHDEVLLERVGRVANTDRLLFPAGVNTSFVMRASDGDRDFYVRTYERGAGFTPSCASGAAASAATLVSLGLAPASHEIQIRNLGGPLRIRIDETQAGLWPTQSGNATYVYRTAVDIAMLINGELENIGLDAYPDEIQCFDALWWRNTAHLVSLGIPTS